MKVALRIRKVKEDLYHLVADYKEPQDGKSQVLLIDDLCRDQASILANAGIKSDTFPTSHRHVYDFRMIRGVLTLCVQINLKSPLLIPIHDTWSGLKVAKELYRFSVTESS